jgi:hypothetical protein
MTMNDSLERETMLACQSLCWNGGWLVVYGGSSSTNDSRRDDDLNETHASTTLREVHLDGL